LKGKNDWIGYGMEMAEDSGKKREEEMKERNFHGFSGGFGMGSPKRCIQRRDFRDVP